MQQMKLLHKEFQKELPFVHKTRLNGLMNACTTAAQKFNWAWTKRFFKHNGLGLKKSLIRTPKRMDILLLIAAIATFTAWFARLITTLTGKATDFQAHSAKFTASLSIVSLPVFSKKYLLSAYKLFLQMVIDSQLEHGIYE
ncbi:MAG: hypothetical protein ACOVQX_07400 [Legionella sp.]